MHIFRHTRTDTTVRNLVATLDRAAATEDSLDLLMAAARLECGLADLWSYQEGEDDWDARRRAAIELTINAAKYYLGGLMECPWPATADKVAPYLPGADVHLTASEPEGVRYYGLSPAGYAASAQAWQAVSGNRVPAWVLGLRSMGSVLAPVVVAALQPTRVEHRCLTLRPAGSPSDRRVRVSAHLQAQLAAWPGEYLIVDEGPGLSGSTFGGVVAFLTGLGIATDRIAVFPSWALGENDAARLNSAYTARGWLGWRRYPAAPLPPPITTGAPAEDISGGRWRNAMGLHLNCPVWEQHERLKYLTDEGHTWVKFAGLGSYGRQTLERARRLAQAGWGPPLTAGGGDEIRAGWIRYRRLATDPLGHTPPQEWTEFTGTYLAWLRSEFALGQQPEAPTAALQEMAEINLNRLLGAELFVEPVAAVPVALDGRMLREEWGKSAQGWVKFDGTDHHDDPFFPGPTDIAWDLAAVKIEFGGACGEAVLATYCRRSGEDGSRVRLRRRWHEIAYSAFRAAYCSFASTQLGTPDAERFRTAAEQYRARCARLHDLSISGVNRQV